MIGVLTLYRTSIGKKVIMAVTGLIWVGFVVGHMYGNLKVFGGAAYFNAYAEGLRSFGHPLLGHGHALWIVRIVLLAAVSSHVWAAWELYREAAQARSVKYVQHTKLQATSASLTMRYGGVAIFLFIIFHLMHLTLGVPGIHPDFIYGDAYHNLVVGFQSYLYIPAILYLVAVVALGLHLYHGAWSMFQTLGLNNRTYTRPLRIMALTLALVVCIGFAVVPLSVIFGILTV